MNFSSVGQSVEHAFINDRTIQINGLRLHYLESGSPGARSLVFLHGIARVARTFEPLIRHYSQKFHVFALDMRGHGDSEWHAEEKYRVEDYTEEVEAFIKALQLKNIILWGASTGGRVAQMIGGRQPDNVSAVVVEDVGPERPIAVSNRRAERMSREANGWPTRQAMMAQLKVENPRTPDATLEHLANFATRKRDDGCFVWKRDPAILKGFVPTELWQTIRLIRAPLMYVLGGASKIVPETTQQEILQALPHAKIVTMPGLGHYPSDEDPQGFIDIVDRFLTNSNLI